MSFPAALQCVNLYEAAFRTKFSVFLRPYNLICTAGIPLTFPAAAALQTKLLPEGNCFKNPTTENWITVYVRLYLYPTRRRVCKKKKNCRALMLPPGFMKCSNCSWLTRDGLKQFHVICSNASITVDESSFSWSTSVLKMKHSWSPENEPLRIWWIN